MNLDVPLAHASLVEVLVNGLPVYQGAQVAVDTAGEPSLAGRHGSREGRSRARRGRFRRRLGVSAKTCQDTYGIPEALGGPPLQARGWAGGLWRKRSHSSAWSPMPARGQLVLQSWCPHQLSSTSWCLKAQARNQLEGSPSGAWCPAPVLEMVRDTSPQPASAQHQLASSTPAKLAAGLLASSSPQSWCGTPARTSFQAPAGLEQPSSWLRAGVPHQLSSTSWFKQPSKLTSPHQLSSTSWPRAALKLAAGWCPAPAFKHQLASSSPQAGAGHQPAPAFKHQLVSSSPQAGCGLVSRTSFQAPAGLKQPSKLVRDTSPHQLSSTSWPRAALKLAAGHQPAPAFKHQLASQAALKAGAGHQPAPVFKHQLASSSPQAGCGLVSRTSFQAPAGLKQPSKLVRDTGPHQLSSTSWPRAALKLAAGWCPAPAFKHQLASSSPQNGTPARAGFQAPAGLEHPSSWLRAGSWPQAALKAGAGHQPAPAFKHQLASSSPQAGCGLVSRTSFQAPAGLKQPSKLVRDTSPHQLSSTNWPRAALKLAAGWCPAPAFKHQLASSSPQSWCGTPQPAPTFKHQLASSSPQAGCGLVSHTSFQAPAGLKQPSKLVRDTSLHQLSSTSWPRAALKLAAGWCPAPAFKHQLASSSPQSWCGTPARTSFQAGLEQPSSWLRAGVPHQLSSTSWPQAALKAGAGHQPAPAFKHQLASSSPQAGCRLVSRTSFQAPAGLKQPSKLVRDTSPHQLSSTSWPRAALKLAAGWCPAPAFKHQLPSKLVRDTSPHQLSSTSWPRSPQAGCGLVSRTSFQAPAGLKQPSKLVRDTSPHQLSSTSWPRAALKLAAGWCPAPAFKHQLASSSPQSWCGTPARTSFQAPAGLEQPSSWLRAGVPHQLSSTSWPQAAPKAGAGHQPAPAFKHQLASSSPQAGCGLVSRTSFQAPAGLKQPSKLVRDTSPHQLSSTSWPRAALKLAAGWCPAPAFKHQLASSSPQSWCGTPARTSFQAPAGLEQPSSWLRAGVPHQLSSTSCPKLVRDPAFKHQVKAGAGPSFQAPAGLEQPSSWLRAGVPHQLSRSWSSGTPARTSFQAPAGLEQPSSWLRAPHQLSSTSWPQAALKAGAGHQPAPAFKHQLASSSPQAGCGLVSRTSFQAPAGLKQPSKLVRDTSPHQLSSTSWPRAALKLAAGWCPAPAFKHQLASSSPQSWCGLVSRTSFQAPAGLEQPSSWLRAGVPHQLSSTSWPRAALKLAAGWCPAPAFKHQLASSSPQSWCGTPARTSFQAPAGLEQPSSWLRAGVPHQLSSTSWPQAALKAGAGHQPAPAFKHQLASSSPQAGCGLVSRTSFQAPAGLKPSKLVRDTSPHQLSSTSWPQAALKAGAGHQPAPAFKHQLASSSPQAGCGLVSRTSFQAPAGLKQPSKLVRDTSPHQLSSTSWPRAALKLAAGWCPASFQAPAGLKQPSKLVQDTSPHQLSSTSWPRAALKLAAGWCPAPAFKHQLASSSPQSWCGTPARTSFQAPAGLEQPSSWLRAGVPHQLSSTSWPQAALKAGAGHQPAPAFKHQLASSSPQAGCGLVSRTSFQAPAGLKQPSKLVRDTSPHQLSSTSWPRAALKLAAGWCPAPAFKHQLASSSPQSWCGTPARTSFQAPAGLEQPSSWLRAGVPHQLSSTSWPQAALKAGAGHQPAPAFKHQSSPQAGCGLVSRTSFQAPAGLKQPSKLVRDTSPHQLSSTSWP